MRTKSIWCLAAAAAYVCHSAPAKQKKKAITRSQHFTEVENSW